MFWEGPLEEAAPELGEREKRSRQRRPRAKVPRLSPEGASTGPSEEWDARACPSWSCAPPLPWDAAAGAPSKQDAPTSPKPQLARAGQGGSSPLETSPWASCGDLATPESQECGLR